MTPTVFRRAAAAVLFVLVSSPRSQLVFTEIEPNDTKAQAGTAVAMRDGDTLVGTTDLGEPDYWCVQTAAAPPGLYRHTLNRVFTPGSNGSIDSTIRGLTQTGGVIDPGSDVPVQVAGTPFIPTGRGPSSWYGFGRAEKIVFRVEGGGVSNPLPYTYVLRSQSIAPTVVVPGYLNEGPITISTQSVLDTDFWVYDGDYSPLPGYGNDDAATGTTSAATRTFSADPGIYFLALARRNLANDQPSPIDDANRSGDVLEFPDAVLTDINLGAPVTTDFTHGNPPRTTSVTTPSLGFSMRVAWIRFEVAPPNAIPAGLPQGSTTTIFTAGSTPDVAVTGQNGYTVARRDAGRVTDIGFSFSRDGGATWSAERGIPGSTAGFDPAVAADGNDVFVTWGQPGTAGTVVRSAGSTDGGVTWSFGLLSFTSPGGAHDVAAQNGLDAGGGAMFAVYQDVAPAGGGITDVYFAISPDAGATFGPPLNLSQAVGDGDDPSVATRGDDVFVAWAELRPQPSVRLRRSADGGATFGPVETVAAMTGPAANAAPDVTVDPRTGAVAVTWVDNPQAGSADLDVFMAQSVGGGAFSAPANVSRSPADLSLLPRIAAQDGIFHVVWTEFVGGGAGEVSQSSIPANSSVGPSVPARISATPGVSSAFAAPASDGSVMVVVYAEGDVQPTVELATGNPYPRLATVGTGGCGGVFGVPGWSLVGDLGTPPSTLTLGPGAPLSPGFIAFAAGLAATPFPVFGCPFELDMATLIAVPVVADAFGTFALTVTVPLAPGSVYGQGGFVDPQRPLTFSTVVELANQ